MVVFSCVCKKIPVKIDWNWERELVNYDDSSITWMGLSIEFLRIPCEENEGNLVMRLNDRIVASSTNMRMNNKSDDHEVRGRWSLPII